MIQVIEVGELPHSNMRECSFPHVACQATELFVQQIFRGISIARQKIAGMVNFMEGNIKPTNIDVDLTRLK
jgi:hypothetical protein